MFWLGLHEAPEAPEASLKMPNHPVRFWLKVRDSYVLESALAAGKGAFMEHLLCAR